MKYATEAQIEALLNAAKDNVRDYAILTVAYWRGLRASEVGAIMLEDYKPDEQRLFVHRAKGSQSGEYLLSPAEVKALSAWLKVRGRDPGPLFVTKRQSSVSRKLMFAMMRHYGSKAGWPRELQHPHVLRHSIAVHLVNQGMDLLMIRDWLGHRSITSTVIYSQVTNPARDKAAMQVYAAKEKPKVRVNWKKVQK